MQNASHRLVKSPKKDRAQGAALDALRATPEGRGHPTTSARDNARTGYFADPALNTGRIGGVSLLHTGRLTAGAMRGRAPGCACSSSSAPAFTSNTPAPPCPAPAMDTPRESPRRGIRPRSPSLSRGVLVLIPRRTSPQEYAGAEARFAQGFASGRFLRPALGKARRNRQFEKPCPARFSGEADSCDRHGNNSSELQRRRKLAVKPRATGSTSMRSNPRGWHKGLDLAERQGIGDRREAR